MGDLQRDLALLVKVAKFCTNSYTAHIARCVDDNLRHKRPSNTASGFINRVALPTSILPDLMQPIIKDTIAAVKETLGMGSNTDKTNVSTASEATPDTLACTNPQAAAALFDKAKHEVEAAREEATAAQVGCCMPAHSQAHHTSLQAKACEAASTIQIAAAKRTAAEQAALEAEQQLQEAAAQEAHIKEDKAQAAAEAARKLADARGEAAEKQQQHDVALHDASLLKAPVQHATQHATECV